MPKDKRRADGDASRPGGVGTPAAAAALGNCVVVGAPQPCARRCARVRPSPAGGGAAAAAAGSRRRARLKGGAFLAALPFPRAARQGAAQLRQRGTGLAGALDAPRPPMRAPSRLAPPTMPGKAGQWRHAAGCRAPRRAYPFALALSGPAPGAARPGR